MTRLKTKPRTMMRVRAAPRAKGPIGSFLGGWEIAHRYGERVHILNNRFLLSVLARVGAPEVRHPEINELLRVVYRGMTVTVAGRELPTIQAERPTRMAEKSKAGIYRGEVLDPATRVVAVSVIRAGIIPAQVCFDMLNGVLDPANVRLDHLTMERVTDARGRVTGVSLEGSKIGGTVEGSVLLLPDPMGATGTTTSVAVRHYKERFGVPAKVVCMPMIATPEYLRRVLGEIPEAIVYTARLDRGLSAPEVLASVPGERWGEERGLDDQDYIVPGAGGMGEVLNNSWC